MTGSRTRRIALAITAALGLAGCSTDPEFWDAVAMGLDQAAAELEYENAWCYWAPPPGLPYGANQRYCPGDYGYRDIYIPPDSPYWRRQAREGYRDQHRGRGDHHRRGGGHHRGR